MKPLAYTLYSFKLGSASGKELIAFIEKFTEISAYSNNSEIKGIIKLMNGKLVPLRSAVQKYDVSEASKALVKMLKESKEQYSSIYHISLKQLKSKKAEKLAAAKRVSKRCPESPTELYKGLINEKLGIASAKMQALSQIDPEDLELLGIEDFVENFTLLVTDYNKKYTLKASDSYDANAEENLNTIRKTVIAMFVKLRKVIDYVQCGDTPDNKFVALANKVWAQAQASVETSKALKNSSKNKKKPGKDSDNKENA